MFVSHGGVCVLCVYKLCVCECVCVRVCVCACAFTCCMSSLMTVEEKCAPLEHDDGAGDVSSLQP